MPDSEPTAIEVRVIEAEQKWWASPKRLEVFRLLIEGNSLTDIAETTNKRLVSVKQVVSNPFFLNRLERYLSRVLFNFQVNKVLAIDEVFKLYWDVITGKKKIEGFGIDDASKHFLKILALKDNAPQIINPKQYNLIMNILRPDSVKGLKDLAETFGFKNLQLPSDEGPKPNSKLDTGAKDSDKQGPAN